MKAERTNEKFLCGITFLVCLVMVLSIQKQIYSQVNINQSDIMKIFTPGTPLYFIPGTSGQINIGNMNGPNTYDFTFVNMQNLFPAYNYSANQIPALTTRYPLNAHTMGEGIQNIVENPVFLTIADSFYIIGEATVENEYRFEHYMPYELFAKFPIEFNPPTSNFWQWISVFDTTFNLNWQIVASDFFQTIVDVSIDGYGILKLPGYDLECLRMRREYSWFQYKEFLFLTREGVLIVVDDVPLIAPNTGLVDADYHILLSESFVSVEGQNQITMDYKLHQNYPNPFNPSTRIQYQVSSITHVTLKVYDILGNEVATLVNEEKPEGIYEVEFNLPDGRQGPSSINHHPSSGIYFCRLRTENYSKTIKMLYLK